MILSEKSCDLSKSISRIPGFTSPAFAAISPGRSLLASCRHAANRKFLDLSAALEQSRQPSWAGTATRPGFAFRTAVLRRDLSSLQGMPLAPTDWTRANERLE